MKVDKMAHLHDIIEEKAKSDPMWAIAYALLKSSEAQERLATHVKYLGNGDASTAMGAIEAFGQHIGEKIDALANAILESRDD